MPSQRDLPRQTQMAIARGLLRGTPPHALTEKGERHAEDKASGVWDEDKYDVGDYGWDPGDNFD